MFLGIDIRVLAIATLALQAVLFVGAVYGAYLARAKRLVTHCTIMRVTVLLLIVAVALMMIPSLLGFLKFPRGAFFIEVLVHHSLGSAVILIWVYVNLVLRGTIRMLGNRLIWPMRVALVFWAISFFLGLHMYLRIY